MTGSLMRARLNLPARYPFLISLRTSARCIPPWMVLFACLPPVHDVSKTFLQPLRNCPVTYSRSRTSADITVINAALTVLTIILSGQFNLTKTYFILSGTANGNPRMITLRGVAFARFAIQVDTQMVWDAREVPPSWKSGHVPMGENMPDSFPRAFRGSEIYELNGNLRKFAMDVAQQVTLEDSEKAAATRAMYALNRMYEAATLPPRIIEGDVLSSNTFWHGFHFSERMDNVAKVYTDDKGRYAMAAQEDSAILTGWGESRTLFPTA